MHLFDQSVSWRLLLSAAVRISLKVVQWLRPLDYNLLTDYGVAKKGQEDRQNK